MTTITATQQDTPPILKLRYYKADKRLSIDKKSLTQLRCGVQDFITGQNCQCTHISGGLGSCQDDLLVYKVCLHPFSRASVNFHYNLELD